MKLSISNVCKSFSKKPVLRNISLELKGEELLSIVGPSGVGKTTLLRILAGIESTDSGKIHFLPTKELWQPIIMVFQDFMLFPHINIWRNITYGIESPKYYRRIFPDDADHYPLPKYRQLRRKRITALAKDYITSFGLEGLEHKFPAQLSAGQRQRVALARAMLIRPPLLLLDEPFANLDQNLKMETALFIKSMQKKYGVSILAVTHDLQEAFAMSDRIAVMLGGEILQVSDVETLYRFPVNLEVGQFLGAINFIPESLWDMFEFSSSEAPRPQTSGEQGILTRAESLDFIADEKGQARISEKRFQGSLIHVEIECAGQKFISYKLSTTIQPGQTVRLLIRDYVYFPNT